MGVFVVDTNFFIQAHRAYYPIDVFPGYWQKIKQLAAQEKIISIDKVGDEIFRGADPLAEWCAENLTSAFFKETTSVLNSYQLIVQWAANANQYTPSAISTFLNANEADAWLVAFANSDPANRSLVTYEKSEPLIKRSIKIPEACNQFGVQYLTPVEMLRQLGERI